MEHVKNLITGLLIVGIPVGIIGVFFYLELEFLLFSLLCLIPIYIIGMFIRDVIAQLK